MSSNIHGYVCTAVFLVWSVVEDYTGIGIIHRGRRDPTRTGCFVRSPAHGPVNIVRILRSLQYTVRILKISHLCQTHSTMTMT